MRTGFGSLLPGRSGADMAPLSRGAPLHEGNLLLQPSIKFDSRIYYVVEYGK